MVRASSPAASRRMRSVRQRGSRPELLLRKALFAAGLRYRLQQRVVPGSSLTVDVAFPRQRVAVLVHGCFWHVCPAHATWPKQNAAWWSNKLETNRRRDEVHLAALRQAGWTPVVVWAHESAQDAVKEIRAALEEPADAGAGA